MKYLELKSPSKRYRRARTHYKLLFQNDVEDIVAKTFQTSDKAYFVTYLIFTDEKMVSILSNQLASR